MTNPQQQPKVQVESMQAFASMQLHHKLLRDHDTLRSFFGSYVYTTLGADGEHGHGTLRTPEQLRPLPHTQLPEAVAAQLKEIRDINTRMMRAGHASIDLMGIEGMRTGTLANVMMTDTQEVRIVNAQLLEGRSILPIGILLMVIAPIVRLRQRWILKKLLHD